jgi:hypothetical protein
LFATEVVLSDYIDYAEVASGFRRIETVFDRDLDACRERLDALGYAISDHSNRSGFEKSGFPYFVWSYWFDLETKTNDGHIDLVRVDIEYLQPGLVSQEAVVTCTCSAETFRLGATGTRYLHRSTLPVSDLKKGFLLELVLRQTELARTLREKGAG